MSPRKRRIFHRRHFPFARILLALALLWGVLWLAASFQLKKRFEGWLASEHAAGHEVGYETSAAGGFPFKAVKRVKGFRWSNGSGFSASAGRAEISLFPWYWRGISVFFDGGVFVNFPAGGADDKVSLKSDSAHLRISYPLFPPESHADEGMGIAFESQNITVKFATPSPFGDLIGRAALKLRIMGSPPDFSSVSSIAAWNAGSGVIEIDELILDWGVLKLAVSGTIGLDRELQPEGAFSGRIGKRGEVVKALMDKKWIGKSEAGLLTSALNLLSESAGGEKEGETLPLSVQSGGLFLGPVRVMTLPRISWR